MQLKFRLTSVFWLMLIAVNVSWAEEKSNSGIEIQKVWPEKLFFEQGVPVKGTITVKNSSKEPIAFSLKVWLTNDIDTAVGTKQKELDLPAGEQLSLKLTWPGELLKTFGHAMKAEILVSGKVISKSEEYFSTAANIWEVGISGGHPLGGYTADRAKSNANVERAVDLYRKKYVNTFEKFFWAPDDFADLTPDKETWFAGQVRYHEHLGFLKHMCKYGNKIGVLPITYGKSMGGGSAARDIIREKPELIYGYGKKMHFFPDTEELNKWDIAAEKRWQPGTCVWARYNMNDPAVVQHGIDELIASTKMFGWAGVRFDGHFQARAGKWRVGDKIVNFTPEMADKQTAENTRMMKDKIRKEFPNYVFGYNWAGLSFPAHLEKEPREMIELCRGGGQIMDEYAKHIVWSTNPFSKWSKYAEEMVKESEQVRRLGGHLFPMLYSDGPISRYQTIFIMAAGAHPNIYVPWQLDHHYPRFATRYSSILWHKDIKNVWNPNGLIIIKSSVLWENYVREQRLSENRKRLIIHVINPPVQKYAYETCDLTKEQKKRQKLNKEERSKLPPINLYPLPQKNVNVKIVPQALGEEWQATRTLIFDPETATHRKVELDKSDPYFWQVTIPELKLWSIIVVDLEVKK